MALGCRVVRGPDWKWGDQDGGEGSVGTIVDLNNFADGRKLPSKTVLVCWDCGKQADYRIGLDGCYDLRVFDSSSAGVVFKVFTCDGCMHSGITGIRWHCTECNDYDLCNVCYLNGVHDKNHAFMRFHISNDRTNGTIVGKRSDVERNKIRSKGMFPGALVKQGRDWTMDNELGSKVGKVVGLTSYENVPRSAVLVNWDNSLEIKHRLGYEGKDQKPKKNVASGCIYHFKLDCKVELTLVQAANGPFYYKDHLPLVSTINVPRPAFAGGNGLREGDMVKTELDVETLKQLAEGHGGWVDDMGKVIGQVGRVFRIDEDGDVHVRYGAKKWVFHPEALCKVTIDLRTGDKVRIVNNKETVMNLQDGHGGWNNAMEKVLGKVGKVIKVIDNGDMVVSIEGNVWVFNPSVLILESKEEERVPAGQEDPSDSSTTALELLLHAMLEGVSKAGSSSETGLVEKTFLVATTIGDLDKVKQIIGKNKALVNHKFSSNKTPLQVACHQGKPEIVSYLLEHGADKELRDGEGYTALHHAAYGDETGVCVVVMLSANAQVNPTDQDRTKVTPLHLAVQRGNEAAVAALVQSKHCDVNCQDVLGDTPLHEAILRGQDSIFTYLIKAQNLDPTICNANGFNILHLATLKDCQHAAKLLIEKFPGLVDFVKEDGFSALHVAAINNHHEIAKHLILSGHCTINLQNEDGMTAIALAVSRSHKEVIELLIEHKADVNVEDKEGDTPLHVAVMKHCIGFVGVNLEAIGLKPPAGVNAEKAIALFLVTRGGARTDYTNHQGKTPLDLCIDEELKGMLRRQDAVRRNRQPGGTQATLALPAPAVPSSARAPSPRTAGPQTTAPSVAAKPIIPSFPPSSPTRQGGTRDALAAPGPPVPGTARAPSPRTTGPQSTAPSVAAKPIPSFPPSSPTQQGGTRDALAAPGPPVPGTARTPSPRTAGPQSTAPPVRPKPIIPSSPPSSPTQQGGSRDALGAPGPPEPGTARAPSPRTTGPQSIAPSVAAKPIIPSFPPSSPTQQGGSRDALGAPGPPEPGTARAPSPRTTGPQSIAPSVAAKPIIPSFPPSSPTQQGGTRDALTAPGPGSARTPLPRMADPQSTAPPVRPKPTPPPSSGNHFQDPLPPFPEPKPINPPPKRAPSLEVAKAEGRVTFHRPIDTRSSATSEVSSRSTDSRTMAPGAAPGPSAPRDAAGGITMALASFNLNDDTPAPNVGGACSAESERKNPNLDIASEIQSSSIEKTKMVKSQKSNVQDEQCHYCREEKATVIFEPCNHKVVCRGCSVRARVCLLCREKVINKIAPGTNTPLSLSDIKKDYEKKIADLERVANCQICMEDTPSNVVFRPCGHKSCSKCADRLYKCHSCYIVIEERIVSYQ